jgi:hypothetical protein
LRSGERFANSEIEIKRPVAIKILVSELGKEHQEASLHRRLSCSSIDHPGRNNVAQLFDTFEVQGPNGVHQCLVMELLGPSMALLAESYTANRLPGDVAWKVAGQVVQAIAYIHRVGIVHGGLRLVVQPAKYVCLRSTSRQHRACRRKDLEDVCRGCTPIDGLAGDCGGSWEGFQQPYTAVSCATIDTAFVPWSVKQLQSKSYRLRLSFHLR